MRLPEPRTPLATRPLTIAGLCLAGLSIPAGCSYRVVSPPARMINLESAKTASPSETVVGAHAAGYAAIFNPGALVASAGVRRGVTESVEVDADASWAHVSYESSGDDPQPFPNIDRNVYAARLGTKVGLANWAALMVGAGGGFAPAGGGFAALDAGAAFSYPNCWVVPFGNATVFGSQPLGAKQVDFRSSDGSLIASDKADFTYGFGLGAGVEVPLDHARCREGRTSTRFQLGVGTQTMIPGHDAVTMTTTTKGDTTTTETKDQRYGVIGLSAGFEVPF